MLPSECTQTTPEFLAWTLAQPCALKTFDDWQQPERAERHLRSARAYGSARREGRCRGDLCYDQVEAPTNFFHVPQVLRIYGGADRVLTACQQCPANVLEQAQPGSLAGCYGELPLPQPTAAFYEEIERAIERLGLAEAIGRQFPTTSPRWFGLWMLPVTGERAGVLAQLTAESAVLDLGDDGLLLHRALVLVAQGEFPLHAVLYPRGAIAGQHWRLSPYCVHCKAEIADYRKPCPACGGKTTQMPSLIRHLRGNRPWQRL